MGLYKQFKTDDALVKSGRWFEYFDEDTGKVEARFLCSYFNEQNPSFLKVREQKTRKVRRQMASDTLPAAALRAITMEIFVDGCLQDWQKVTDQFDKPLPFSKEAALKLFMDLPALYDDLVTQASSHHHFRETTVEEDVGNLPKSSTSS